MTLALLVLACGPGSIELGKSTSDSRFVDTGIPATDSGNGRVPHDSGDTSETGFADTAETGGEETGSQETGSVDTAETGDTGEDTGTEPTYSPCEESWVRLGYEAYLYTPVGGESNVEITLSTSTDFISLVWEDSSAPYSFYISCVETSGGLAGIIPAQYEDEYYASAWNEAEEGVTWHWDYATALSRDGVAFYSQGHSGDATRFTSTP